MDIIDKQFVDKSILLNSLKIIKNIKSINNQTFLDIINSIFKPLPTCIKKFICKYKNSNYDKKKKNMKKLITI